MNHNDTIAESTEQATVSQDLGSISVDASKVPNAVLQRLIEEVQNENQNNILAYNRTHNRHNRGR